MCKIHEIEWRPLVGYEDKFLISNRGFIFNTHTKKIIATRKDPQGYIQADLTYNREQKTNRIHRLVALTFIPNPDSKPAVNHKDGDKNNNCLENLEWVTNKENTTHAYQKGLLKNTGENNTQAKLTNQQVLEIRELKGKLSQSKIGHLYGISQTTVGLIHRNKTWRL